MPIKNLLPLGSRLLLTLLVGKLHPKKHRSRCEVSRGTPALTPALFTLAQRWNQPSYPSAEEMKKKYIYAMESYTRKTK